MEKAESITRELRDWGSALADYPRNLPFSAPKGYFERAVRDGLGQVRQECPESLLRREGLPFSLPGNYFDRFPELLMDRIRQDALLQEGGQKGSLPFDDLPEDYFARFSDRLLERLRQESPEEGEGQPKMPAEGLPRRRRIPLRAWSWAAAAALILFLSLGIFERIPSGDHDPLATVSQEDWTSFALEQVDRWEDEAWMETLLNHSGENLGEWVAALDPEAIKAYLADWEEDPESL